MSVWDRGLLLGDGVFETMHAIKGRVIALQRHWKRLVFSCEFLRIQPPAWPVFSDAVAETLQASQLDEARVRFTVTRGHSEDRKSSSAEPTMLVTAAPLLHSYDQPASVAFASWPRNEASPFCNIKSTSYAEQLRALEEAKSAGADEAIFINTHGHLAEGATSNLFLISEQSDELLTPSLDSGCLPGIMRSVVLDLAERHGIAVCETVITKSQLPTCREAFLTSSLRHIQPIQSVNGSLLPAAPGPVTTRLSELLADQLAANPDC